MSFALGEVLAPEVRAALDKPARKVHNRGLGAYVRTHLHEVHQDEYRAEDVHRALNVKGRYPAAGVMEVSAVLSELTRAGAIERVGFGRTGIYRSRGTAANLEDEAVIENALKALGDLELLARRYREVVNRVRELKKALGGV